MGRYVDARNARMAVMGVSAMRAASTVLGAPMLHEETGDLAEKNLNGSEPGAESGVPVRCPAPLVPDNGQRTVLGHRRT